MSYGYLSVCRALSRRFESLSDRVVGLFLASGVSAPQIAELFALII